jgi:hypothetical protein
MRHETAGTFYRPAHVLSPAFVTALIVACTTLPRTQQTPRPRVDTTFVFVADSGSSTTFPLLTERPRAERFLADPDPPPCAVSAPPDTSEWRVDTAPGNSRYIQRITLLLPTAYEPFDRQHLPDRPDTFRETGAYWEHSLGSWWFIKPDATPAEHAVASFGVWIGPDGRYPTVGVSPTPRQVDLHECRLDVSGVQAYAVLFTLADSTGARTRYVGAYWPLEDGVWLSALGDSPESLGPTDFLFALRSMKVLRP